MDSRTSLLAPPLGEGSLSSLSLSLTAPACATGKEQGSETSAHHSVRTLPQSHLGIFSFSSLPWLYHQLPSQSPLSQTSALGRRGSLTPGEQPGRSIWDPPPCDSEGAPRGLLSGAPQQTLRHVVEKAMATHLCRLSQGQNCQLNSGALLTN